jgi:hypothetical protein
MVNYFTRMQTIKLFLRINRPLFLAIAVMAMPAILHSQNVGIQNPNPSHPLSFSNDAYGNRILLYGNGNNAHIGIGKQYDKVQFYTINPTDHFRFGTGNSSSFNELFRINANGKLGININSTPWSALDIKGNLSFTNSYLPPSEYNNKTGLSGGIYFNDPVNQTPVAFMGIMGSYDPNSYKTVKGVGIASLQPQPNMLFAVQINHGGLILNKREGKTGEVLRSGGAAAPAYWSLSPDLELYDKTGTVCDNLMFEISSAKPMQNLQSLGYQPNLERFAKVLFQTNIRAFAEACGLCSSSVLNLKLLLNGTLVRTYRYTIANGTTSLMNTSTLFDLLPGTPVIAVQLEWVSGPSISISSDYNCRTVKHIPEM